MKKTVTILLVLVMVCLSLPVAFASDLSGTSITVFNCYDYIANDALKEFTKQTGIKVVYTNYTTNEDLYMKLAAGAGNYDVIFPSDYLTERCIREGLIQKLNFDLLPNAAQGDMLPWLVDADCDPTREYSVPYMWGTVGILVDTTQVIGDPITSWKDMFDEKYVNNVFMMDSIRETIGVTLKMLGYPMNTREVAQLEAARDALIEQKRSGIVKAYQVDEIKDKMISGEAAMGLVWSGDAVYAMSESENLVYVIPEEGTNIWVDNMCIPSSAKNIAGAHAFINFLSGPEISGMNVEEIGYSSPLIAVRDNLSDEAKADPAQNPSDEVMARCEYFKDISQDMTLYDRIWMEIRGSR